MLGFSSQFHWDNSKQKTGKKEIQLWTNVHELL